MISKAENLNAIPAALCRTGMLKMTDEEKTSEEIMFNCGGKGFEIDKKWLSSDKAILIEDVEIYLDEFEDFINSILWVPPRFPAADRNLFHQIKIIKQKLKSRGRK